MQLLAWKDAADRTDVVTGTLIAMADVDIAGLLRPYLQPLAPERLRLLEEYLALLLKWNARTNLTSVRRPEEIVTRHFGESLFAAEYLFKSPIKTAIDFGSGAGFPGLPMAIYAPETAFTLMESQNKKATFLKEVVRTVALKNVAVFAGRAEASEQKAELVTMRAVEHFEESLSIAARLLASLGRLALLIGAAQGERVRELFPALDWQTEITIPGSENRVLLVGKS
jgi:16S rRNA (guanine527-N7)-methyltransferase